MHGARMIMLESVWHQQAGRKVGMPGIRFVTGVLFVLAAIAVDAASAAHATDVDASLRADFERIAQRRIFFGHQSDDAGHHRWFVRFSIQPHQLFVM